MFYGVNHLRPEDYRNRTATGGRPLEDGRWKAVAIEELLGRSRMVAASQPRRDSRNGISVVPWPLERGVTPYIDSGIRTQMHFLSAKTLSSVHQGALTKILVLRTSFYCTPRCVVRRCPTSYPDALILDMYK